MAKKKTTDAVSSINASLKEGILAATNADLISGSSYDVCIGPRWGSTVMSYLTNSDVIPLERFIELAGRPGTRKSTFLYELGRIFTDPVHYGGFWYHNETESKDNGPLRTALLQYNRQVIKERVCAVPSDTYEAWHTRINKALAYFGKNMPDYPVLLSLDSLAGAPTLKSREKIEEDGFATSGYPDLAKLLSSALPDINKRLNGMPICFVFTNHYKESLNTMPGAEGTRLGGAAPKFFETLSIRFDLSPKRGAKRQDLDQYWLRLSTLKNSMGPKRKVDIVVDYAYEENPNYNPDDPRSQKFRSKVYFDWGESDIMFLDTIIQNAAPDLYKIPKPRRDAIQELTGINTNKGMAWSDVLGVPKDSAVSYSELGDLYHQRPDIMDKVHSELCIINGAEYKSGMDFEKTRRDYIQYLENEALDKPVTLESFETDVVDFGPDDLEM